MLIFSDFCVVGDWAQLGGSAEEENVMGAQVGGVGDIYTGILYYFITI